MNDELLRQYIKTSLQESSFSNVMKKLGFSDDESDDKGDEGEEPEKIGAGLIELPNPMLIKKVVPLIIAASLKGSVGGYESYLRQNGMSAIKAKAAAAFIPGNWVRMCEWQSEAIMTDIKRAYKASDRDELKSWVRGGMKVGELLDVNPRSFATSVRNLDTLKAVYEQNRVGIHRSGLMLITEDKDIPSVATAMSEKIGTELGKSVGLKVVKKTGEAAGKKMVGVALKAAGRVAGAAFTALGVADVVQTVRKMSAADSLFEKTIEKVFDPRSTEIKVEVKNERASLVVGDGQIATMVASLGKKKDDETT